MSLRPISASKSSALSGARRSVTRAGAAVAESSLLSDDSSDDSPAAGWGSKGATADGEVDKVVACEFLLRRLFFARDLDTGEGAAVEGGANGAGRAASCGGGMGGAHSEECFARAHVDRGVVTAVMTHIPTAEVMHTQAAESDSPEPPAR